MGNDLRLEAKRLNYQRIRFEENWEIELPFPARKILQNAAYLARIEGNFNHARAIESRISSLPINAKYWVGRTKQGCSTGYVGL